MIHILGYVALAMNLLSMAMKEMLTLRVLSAVANFIYIIYGVFLDAPPVIIGGAIAVCIHCYHIYKLRQSQPRTRENQEES